MQLLQLHLLLWLLAVLLLLLLLPLLDLHLDVVGGAGGRCAVKVADDVLHEIVREGCGQVAHHVKGDV